MKGSDRLCCDVLLPLNGSGILVLFSLPRIGKNVVWTDVKS